MNKLIKKLAKKLAKKDAKINFLKGRIEFLSGRCDCLEGLSPRRENLDYIEGYSVQYATEQQKTAGYF